MSQASFAARVLCCLAVAAPLVAQTRPAPSGREAALVSAPISHVRYGVTVDRQAAQRRTLTVTMSFDVAGPAPVLLSLPAWTPGSYTVSNFARNVVGFSPTAGTRRLSWDKTDYQTWRVRPVAAGPVTVTFNYLADSLDNAMAWTRPDFAFFNGTNVFLYPEGRPLDFPATVTITTEPDWLVVTSMHPAGGPRSYQERNYHDLVDMPFFVGRVDVDSTIISGKWTRLASYPAGRYTGRLRDSLEARLARIIPAESAVLADTPWDSYSVMLVFDSSYGGRASALEHQASHLGIYGAVYAQPAADTIVTSVIAHEIFHAWNVKRLRPADMVPYRYAAAEPTPWLWVSEGITDYYADLAMSRAAIFDSAAFLAKTLNNIRTVTGAPPTALEDASLDTWIQPRDGSAYLYYPKGSLTGLMLDILIRDASGNQRSLDAVMRELYRTTYQTGRGFTGADWWSAVRRAAGGKDFADFAARYVEGREPDPFAATFRLAGLRYVQDTQQVARVGVSTTQDSLGIRIQSLVPGGAAERAGVAVGDYLKSVAGFDATDPAWAQHFRDKYNSRPGDELTIVIRRHGQEQTLHATVQTAAVPNDRLEFDPGATPAAIRIRDGILRGASH